MLPSLLSTVVHRDSLVNGCKQTLSKQLLSPHSAGASHGVSPSPMPRNGSAMGDALNRVLGRHRFLEDDKGRAPGRAKTAVQDQLDELGGQ